MKSFLVLRDGEIVRRFRSFKVFLINLSSPLPPPPPRNFAILTLLPQLQNCCEFVLIGKSIFESDFNFFPLVLFLIFLVFNFTRPVSVFALVSD